MTPDDIARRCEEWTRDNSVPKRVVCVEPDGPRRTWLLFEAGRQVGHVRGRCQGLDDDRHLQMLRRANAPQLLIDSHECWLEGRLPWTWEAANAGREVLGG